MIAPFCKKTIEVKEKKVSELVSKSYKMSFLNTHSLVDPLFPLIDHFCLLFDLFSTY